MDVDLLLHHNITTVIDLSMSQKPASVLEAYVRHNIRYYKFPIRDEPDKQIIGPARFAHFIITRSQANTLVHCRMGRSRSVMAVAFHLYWRYNYSAEHIFRLIRFGRPCINPNSGFVRQFLLITK